MLEGRWIKEDVGFPSDNRGQYYSDHRSRVELDDANESILFVFWGLPVLQ